MDVPRKPYGKAHMQFGLAGRTDWQQDSRRDSAFELVMRHQVLAVNRRGGEWENLLKAGTNVEFTSRFYQPLDYGMRNFAEASFTWANINPAIWFEEAPVASYSVSSMGGRLEMGHVFERCCEIRVGPYWFDNEGDVDIGLPVFPSFRARDAGIRALVRLDNQTSVAFPLHGSQLVASYSQSSKTLGSDVEVKHAVLSFDTSLTFGRYTGILSAEAVRNFEEVDDFLRMYPLGGTFRLSGLGEGELLGEKGGLATAMFFREITKLELGPLSTRLLAGATFETGQVYGRDDPVSFDSLRAGGSLFLGSDTPFGPAVIGVGLADRGRLRAFLVIGQRF